MLLVSKLMYGSIYGPQGALRIIPYEAANLGTSHYYFRLGAKREGRHVVPIDSRGLSIEPHNFAQIWSLESFTLSERVMGIFGSPSSLFDHGLQLLNSPFIDPSFDGALSLVLSNLSGEIQTIHAGEKIGKVSFFDVGDTFFDPQAFQENQKRKDLVERFEAAKQLQGVINDLIKPYVKTIPDSGSS
jgi:dUTPase